MVIKQVCVELNALSNTSNTMRVYTTQITQIGTDAETKTNVKKFQQQLMSKRRPRLK